MQSRSLSLKGIVGNQQLKRLDCFLYLLIFKWYWWMCLLIFNLFLSTTPNISTLQGLLIFAWIWLYRVETFHVVDEKDQLLINTFIHNVLISTGGKNSLISLAVAWMISLLHVHCVAWGSVWFIHTQNVMFSSCIFVDCIHHRQS